MRSSGYWKKNIYAISMFSKEDTQGWLSNVVSPYDGAPLVEKGGALHFSNGEVISVVDGIVDILDVRNADDALAAELEVFDAIPVEKVCYFKESIFESVFSVLEKHIDVKRNAPLSCAELGGGEGYFAARFKKHFHGSEAYVCDISLKHLQNASGDLRRIRCDIRKPYLRKNSLSAAVFWVSLHHLDVQDMNEAFEQAVKTLKPGGMMIIFEPNGDFLPRRVFMNSSLRHNVYFDHQEKPLKYDDLTAMARAAGMEEVFITAYSPPYNPNFLKLLKKWFLFQAATDALHLFEGIMRMLLRARLPATALKRDKNKAMLGLGSYIFAIFKKSG